MANNNENDKNVTHWNDYDVVEEFILATDCAQRIVERVEVFGGWIIYRDYCDKDTGKVYASTGVFISDPNHLWKIEK